MRNVCSNLIGKPDETRAVVGQKGGRTLEDNRTIFKRNFNM
jgi:hypothetical protein